MICMLTIYIIYRFEQAIVFEIIGGAMVITESCCNAIINISSMILVFNICILLCIMCLSCVSPHKEMCLTVRHISAGFCTGNPFSVLDLQNALSGGGIFLHHVLAHHIRIVGVEGSNPFESTK